MRARYESVFVPSPPPTTTTRSTHRAKSLINAVSDGGDGAKAGGGKAASLRKFAMWIRLGELEKVEEFVSNNGAREEGWNGVQRPVCEKGRLNYGTFVLGSVGLNVD